MIVREKKQYITPQFKSVELGNDAMLAPGSPNGSLGFGGDNTESGAPTEAEGRGRSFWGDDDTDW